MQKKYVGEFEALMKKLDVPKKSISFKIYTVIASKAHERIARRAATDGERLNIELVNDSRVIEADGRRIEIFDIGPTAHTEHLLVAWLPNEGILFEADHFAMPRVGPVPPAVSSTKTFAEALQGKGLDVKQFVSAHSPKPGTREDLEAALNREEYQAKR